MKRRRLLPTPAKPLEREVEAIHRRRREALLSDGEVIPIASFHDHDGTKLGSHLGALYCVAGPDHEGKWWSISLLAFPERAVGPH